MRELARTRVRFGCRRLLVMVHREGWEVGKHRVYRLCIDEGLALRRKRPWRLATAVPREQRRPGVARNEIWSMDFVADQLADGRRCRALTVIDLFTRECQAIDVGHGLSGRDVVATLERLRFERGLPQRIYCDNEKIDTFRWDYNENHPHQALKGLSPREYGQRAMATAANSPSSWTRKPGPLR
jgi:putative transposase